MTLPSYDDVAALPRLTQLVVPAEMGDANGDLNVRYLDEVMVGDSVSTRYRTLGRTPKAVHLMSFLLDDTRRTLASTVEIVTVHVDLDTRRTTPIDAADATRLDARITADAALPWAAPTSGVIALRAQGET